MKARKSFAFVLALMMILTLVPASAFAATDNTVVKVPAVAADTIMPYSTLTSVVKDATGLAAGSHQTVKFTVENGEWALADPSTAVVAPSTTALPAGNPTNATQPVTVTTGGAGAAAGDVTATVVSVGDNWIEIDMTTVNAIPKDNYIAFSLAIKSGDADGDVKVKVESIDSQISGGTYTVATVAGGDTVATVPNKPVLTSRAAAVAAADIEIRETSVNSVSTVATDITLTLPKGVTWNAGMLAAKVVGNMKAAGVTTITGQGTRDLNITFNATPDPALRQVLVIKPLIDIGKDARLGNIDVQIRANSGDIEKASGLTIAEYTEEGVSVTTVKEKDIPTIYAGYEQDGNKDYEVKVIIEENTDGSLIAGKYIDFEFPEWVQLTDVNGTPGEVDVKVNGAVAAGTGILGYKGDDTSSFEWAVTGLGAGKDKFEFIIPVTVEAGHSGNLEIKVTGAKAGIDDTTLVVAKVVNPVTAEAKLTDLKTGVQKQVGGQIVIKETEVGAIRDDNGNNLIVVSLEDLGARFSPMAFKDATAKVTAGDLEIKDKVTINNGTIEITVDKSSIKTAAEITISDIEITLDRTLPEGKYAVRVGGNSIVDNDGTVPTAKPSVAANGYNKGDFTSHSVKADYVTVITAADLAAVNAKFVIGSKDYVVNGATKTMDAEAYIDTAGRTMVPVRFVADALGLNESQIIWNQATTTATLIGKQVVSITVGDAKIIASGTVIPMDTVAVNLNGRIYVPARYVANALGASVDWDAATKTVSIYTVK